MTAKIESAGERAYRVLRQAALEGRLPTDHKITEDGLAKLLGLSRTPVRAAISQLLMDGLLQRRKGQGLWCVLPTRAEMQEIFDIRAHLESYAAARAAAYATAEQKESLMRSAHRMSELVEQLCNTHDAAIVSEIHQENAHFHAVIMKAADAPRLARLLSATVDLAFVNLTLQRYSLRQRVRSASHHHEIAEAISAGMAEWASRSMETHILAAAATFLQQPNTDAVADGSLIFAADGDAK
ncbi:GntR family transcriptional regulator [Paracoccus tibetensis]|uniref:DNA-binding transcriptional regulator, GntR family n=1 Tax=Paracoccus tibetensis TaxID=336292 RepID=A0A1G5K6M6_9RHOB|nr:GntR family transcriptional regulator [Paracoccus tibetensis]SCY96273.1 DNA-binding transcriptional regulator, GntR family [Paracoccus tibetensis]